MQQAVYTTNSFLLVYFFVRQVVLETEVTNGGALNLYTKLGFSKNERLIKYYLNGVDAFRLKLWFR